MASLLPWVVLLPLPWGLAWGADANINPVYSEHGPPTVKLTYIEHVSLEVMVKFKNSPQLQGAVCRPKTGLHHHRLSEWLGLLRAYISAQGGAYCNSRFWRPQRRAYSKRAERRAYQIGAPMVSAPILAQDLSLEYVRFLVRLR